ncbi:CAP domain-containing protein [Brevibacillus porteri]|uniref:SCP domain-containing protein n=1 Tax=Brevibacillus porteri TaxID=2126350 RepID=A0ABX5FVJ9_9BACL|nr:CAP domain-containing protein [Brevibacillus porteri]MED1798777.1 CAP domain-containing protein [Brevibacillus porteri]MED2131460.1 CAP domain-containing protein [Brevibacillus porteri]MED2744014.1 CAP domain-containing protein [Brevibacillus porteri]MED2813743.1 CAP domain-containing protein [Brevibacillus porteri]MED2896545.1 CAP domain-containing protein [Brevibacillus porteri]
MKRFGSVTIAMTLGLGLALTGFASSASAASNCPLKNGQFQFNVGQNMGQFQKAPNAQQFFNFYQKQGQATPVQPYPIQPGSFQSAPVQQAPVQQAPVQPAPAQPRNNVTQPAAPVNQAEQGKTGDFAKQVADLVNQERAKAGLKPVQMDAALSKVALAKAQDMSANNYFDHNSPTYGSPFDMMKQYGIQYSTAGENIAMGQQSPQEVMQQWMNSEGHRQNIMNPAFTKIGVGVTNGYWVQEFIG